MDFFLSKEKEHSADASSLIFDDQNSNSEDIMNIDHAPLKSIIFLFKRKSKEFTFKREIKV